MQLVNLLPEPSLRAQRLIAAAVLLTQGGIAVTGAIVTNRSLFHQARLQEFMQPGSPAFVNQVNALTP